MIDISIQKRLWSADGGLDLAMEFQIKAGQCLAIYGESGAGKTSLLRMLAGLLSPDQGYIRCKNQVWVNCLKNIELPSQKRGVGFLFQDYALFPNMTVKENLKFALLKGQNHSIIAELLQIMELEALQNRKPHTLSGGQKQRAALARALVQKPQLLLLDEPLAALDVTMRQKLQDYLLQVHQEFHLTTILVSHDIAEIFKLADRVLVLKQGRVQQIGTPSEIFQNQNLSGKFQFVGEIVAMSSQDFLWIISVLVGNKIVRVVADEPDVNSLRIGDKVVVASKAFNPVIRKII